MKKILLTLAFLSLAFSANAKEIEVTATGVGEDHEWAVMNAIDNAVKQTSEVTVDRSAPMVKAHSKVKAKASANLDESLDVDDGSLIGGKKGAAYSGKASGEYEAEASAEIKTINAKYKGKISSYEVLSSEEKGGQFHVKIKAKVKVVDDYESPDLIKKSKHSLAISPFKGNKTFACLDGKVSLDVINQQLNSQLVSAIAPTRKFSVVDRENFDSYALENLLIESDMAKESNKSKLKNIVTADYILVGTVDSFNANTSSRHIEMTGETLSNSSASMQISYRLLEAATMEIVSTSTVNESMGGSGGLGSCSSVAQNLAKKAAKQITDSLLTDVFPDYQPKAAPAPVASAPARASAPRAAAKPPVIKLPFDE